jgi:hypothetical protein
LVDLHNGPYCGDGNPHPNEACDDGRNNGRTSCDYGTPTCSICNADCSASVPRTGPVCGDGRPDYEFGEACDDGNTKDETACPYGQPQCTLCSADCKTVLNLTGSYCGDGVPDTANGDEDCDGPSFSCGTCGKQGTPGACKWVSRLPLPVATGSLTVVSSTNLVGVTFTLDDGVSISRPKTFEFITGGSVQAGNIAVDIVTAGADIVAIAQSIAEQINTTQTNGNLSIHATTAGATVTLTNSAAGYFGNFEIVIAPAQSAALTSTGMAGGLGCLVGQPCGGPGDCVTNTCGGKNTLTCRSPTR